LLLIAWICVRAMRAFVTVGSTRFDVLIHAVLDDAVLAALSRRGYDQLVVQCGNSGIDADLARHASSMKTDDDSLERWSFASQGVRVELWRFKPSLQAEFAHADLVISHAGTSATTVAEGKTLEQMIRIYSSLCST
jgi:beta-1,4-N-acetylglucosaminyltransferase